ncbi:hypothetical protein [Vibrio vulnificus]|uniref:hypothetical protein n=1 Tax=Vibrio vulnificus TaxID=672 RepID=UPI001EEC834F|nr:hypothetical protein [Vibrio vulnificus]MCG6288866.1 hypothetical protein [Vibrio vulnificus]
MRSFFPPLVDSAAITVTIDDGGDGYENAQEVPAVVIHGTTHRCGKSPISNDHCDRCGWQYADIHPLE